MGVARYHFMRLPATEAHETKHVAVIGDREAAARQDYQDRLSTADDAIQSALKNPL